CALPIYTPVGDPGVGGDVAVAAGRRRRRRSGVVDLLPVRAQGLPAAGSDLGARGGGGGGGAARRRCRGGGVPVRRGRLTERHGYGVRVHVREGRVHHGRQARAGSADRAPAPAGLTAPGGHADGRERQPRRQENASTIRIRPTTVPRMTIVAFQTRFGSRRASLAPPYPP